MFVGCLVECSVCFTANGNFYVTPDVLHGRVVIRVAVDLSGLLYKLEGIVGLCGSHFCSTAFGAALTTGVVTGSLHKWSV